MVRYRRLRRPSPPAPMPRSPFQRFTVRRCARSSASCWSVVIRFAAPHGTAATIATSPLTTGLGAERNASFSPGRHAGRLRVGAGGLRTSHIH